MRGGGPCVPMKENSDENRVLPAWPICCLHVKPMFVSFYLIPCSHTNAGGSEPWLPPIDDMRSIPSWCQSAYDSRKVFR